MRLFVLFFALLAHCSLIAGQADFEYCEGFVPNADQPSFLAPKLPNRFQTNIESYFDGRIVSYKLYYDYDRRRVTYEAANQNTKYRIILDFETNEIHEIEVAANSSSLPTGGSDDYIEASRKCTTESMNTFKPNTQVGLDPFQKINNTYFIPRTANDILDFNPSTFRYDGIQMINGIATQRYSSCKRYKLRDLNFVKNSTFFFTLPDSEMPFQNPEYKRILVQAIHQVKDSIIHLESPPQINNYYEFKPMVEIDDEHFRTPPGLYCQNRSMSKPLPKIPNQFKYSEELHTANGQSTTHLRDVYYNQKLNIVRYESTSQEIEAQTFFSRDPLRSIHDFNIGVSFTINQARGNCSITPLTLFSLGNDINFTENIFNTMNNSYVVRMKSPSSFLLLDSDYVLTAHGRMINNLPSNVYVSKRNEPNRGDIIAEAAFLGDEFAEMSYSHSVPISLSLRNTENELSYFAFYGFDITKQDLSHFDVSKCFSRDDFTEFKIKYPFKGIVDQKHLTNLRAIKSTFIEMLMNTTDESRTRFSNPSVLISDDGNIYLRSAILPRPPALSYFTLLKGYWLPASHSTPVYNVDSDEECAGYCVARPECLSIEYSTTTKMCFLNKMHGTSGPSTTTSSTRHYSRNTLNGFIARDSSSVWKIVTDSVDDNLLKLEITVPELDNKVFVLDPAGIELVETSKDDALGTTNSMKKYNLKFSNRELREPTDLFTYVSKSIDECARECSNPIQGECNTFSYCTAGGSCALSSLKFTNDTDMTVHEDCDVYEKDSLFNYVQFPGQSAVNKKEDLEYSQVNDPTECAAKCNNELKIHCRSFNYCPNNKACYLSTKHSVDSLSSGLNEDFVCTHYSRNFLSDFVYTATAKIDLIGDIVYQKSNAEECSRYCVSTDAFSCKSFDFCPSTRTCLLHKGLAPKPTNSTSGTDSCANYKREYFYLTSIKASTQKESDDNSGLLIGLSIGAGVIGAILGAVGLLFFLNKRK